MTKLKHPTLNQTRATAFSHPDAASWYGGPLKNCVATSPDLAPATLRYKEESLRLFRHRRLAATSSNAAPGFHDGGGSCSKASWFMEPPGGQKFAWIGRNRYDYSMPPADVPLMPIRQDWLQSVRANTSALPDPAGILTMMKKAICFGCDVVQQIDANLSSARCACGGNILPLIDLNAFRIARLAHRLAGGYYVHSAILDLVPSGAVKQPIDYSIIREVPRKDGTKHQYAFNHYLREAVANTKTKDDLDRVWLTGALISIGDALSKNVRKYFDRAPHLELVRHLRNGIAHGNTFWIKNPDELQKYPANNFNAPVRSQTGISFEITSDLNDHPVMFDFMGPADFIDLFLSVEVHLFSLAVERK